jgi:hypothetical protein
MADSQEFFGYGQIASPDWPRIFFSDPPSFAAGKTMPTWSNLRSTRRKSRAAGPMNTELEPRISKVASQIERSRSKHEGPPVNRQMRWSLA